MYGRGGEGGGEFSVINPCYIPSCRAHNNFFFGQLLETRVHENNQEAVKEQQQDGWFVGLEGLSRDVDQCHPSTGVLYLVCIFINDTCSKVERSQLFFSTVAGNSNQAPLSGPELEMSRELLERTRRKAWENVQDAAVPSLTVMGHIMSAEAAHRKKQNIIDEGNGNFIIWNITLLHFWINLQCFCSTAEKGLTGTSCGLL